MIRNYCTKDLQRNTPFNTTQNINTRLFWAIIATLSLGYYKTYVIMLAFFALFCYI